MYVSRRYVSPTWVAILAVLSLPLYAAEAETGLRFHWSFDTLDENGQARNLAADADALPVAKWSADGGLRESGALVCGEGLRSVKARFPNLRWTNATIELTFKPTAPVGRYSVLFSYGRSTWGRGVFDLYFDGKGHVGALFLLLSDDGKTTLKRVELLSKQRTFEVGRWYCLRVTMERGGMMKLYLDGQLEQGITGGVCFADFAEETPPAYPMVQLGSRVWRGKAEVPFTGLIDEVRIWDRVVSPFESQPTSVGPESGSGGESIVVSKYVDRPPTIDGKLDDLCWATAERTRRFKVLSSISTEVTGLELEAEDRFVQNAATVQICHDDDALYVAYRAHAPEDTPAKAKITRHDDEVWTDDRVELFLDPMQQMGYSQVLVNAIGTVADLERRPGSGAADANWESNARVGVQRVGAGYIVEMAIPFASLGDNPRTAGTAWGVNFTRGGASGGGLSTWAPEFGRCFGTPERFGTLIFESLRAYHERTLKELQDRLSQLPADASPELTASARDMLASLDARIARDGAKRSGWSAIRNLSIEVDSTLRQIVMKDRTYLLWQKDIWGPVSPDERIALEVHELTDVNVFSGRNTRAAAGFLVSNLSAKSLMGRLTLLKPTKDDPLAEGVALLEADRVQFRRGMYIELSNGVMTPDALPALLPCNLVEVPARTTVLLWTEIDTRDLSAGRYTRKVEFFPSYSDFPKTSFDLNLEVASVDLSVPRVKQFTYSVPNAQRCRAVSEDLVRHGITMVHSMPSLRLPGRGIHGWPKLDADGNLVSVDQSHSLLDSQIANMEAAGLPKERMDILIYLDFCRSYNRDLPYIDGDKDGRLSCGTEAWKRGFANSLKSFRDHLFEKGFTYDQIVFYVCDEPHGDPADPESTTAKAIGGSRYVKEVDPRFRTMTNPGLDGEKGKHLGAYLKEFDVIMAYRPNLNGNPALIEPLRESGREMWTYHILLKQTGPAAYRNGSWLSARDGFAGVCAFWAYDRSSGGPFYSYDHHPGSPRMVADYAVVYANFVWEGHADQPMTTIIPSRRWEASYQGNQDYRAVVICRELIGKLKAAGRDASVFQAVVEEAIAAAVNQSGAAMDASRERLIRAAVKMQESLDERPTNAARASEDRQ